MCCRRRFRGRVRALPETYNPQWDEQLIATFSPEAEVSISVWDNDPDGEIEAIGDVTIDGADIVEYVRAGIYEFEDADGTLLNLQLGIQPLNP